MTPLEWLKAYKAFRGEGAAAEVIKAKKALLEEIENELHERLARPSGKTTHGLFNAVRHSLVSYRRVQVKYPDELEADAFEKYLKSVLPPEAMEAYYEHDAKVKASQA